MLKVGLTGGIASGKTTVAAMLEKRGCRVLYADKIARELMRPGQPAYDEAVGAFGKDILAADATIDRPRLAAMVFADPAKLEKLNQIVHPRIIEAIESEFKRIAQADPGAMVIVEAALLVESGYWTRLDKLVVTWSWPEQQIERLMKGGLTREQARARLSAQMPPEQKRDRADIEIDCSGSLAATELQVEETLATLRLAAASRARP